MLFCILDFGLEHLSEVTQQMNFPWLMSNIKDRNTGKLLADGLEKLILQWKGKKVTSVNGKWSIQTL